MNDRFRISSLLADQLREHKLTLPSLLRLAELSAGFFQQERIYATTAELFALWRAIGEMSPDPGIGLRRCAWNSPGLSNTVSCWRLTLAAVCGSGPAATRS